MRLICTFLVISLLLLPIPKMVRSLYNISSFDNFAGVFSDNNTVLDSSLMLNKTYIVWSSRVFPENVSVMLLDMNKIIDLTNDNIPEIAYLVSDQECFYVFIIDGASGEIILVKSFYVTSYSSVSALVLENSSYILVIEYRSDLRVSYVTLYKIARSQSGITISDIWSRDFNGSVDNVIVYGDYIYLYHSETIKCLKFDDGAILWSSWYKCFYGMFTIVNDMIIVPYQIEVFDNATNTTYYYWYVDTLDLFGNLLEFTYIATESVWNVGWFAIKHGKNRVILVRCAPYDSYYIEISFEIARITDAYLTIEGSNDLGVFNYQEYPLLFGLRPSWNIIPLRSIVDVNSDNVPEIIGCTEDGLAVFNGKTGSLMFYVKYNGKNLITKTGLFEPIITLDLTNDGVNDAWVATNLTTFLIDFSRTSANVIYEVSQASNSEIRVMFIRQFLDFDDDQINEILACDLAGWELYCIWGSYDNSPPEIISFLPENNTVVKPGNIKFVVNCSDRSGISSAFIVINNFKAPLEYDPLTKLYTCSCLLYEGEYSWYIIVRDKVGFETTLESMTLYVDETPPSIVVNYPKNYSVVTTSNVTISWKIIEKHLNRTEIRIDGGEWIIIHNATKYSTVLTSGLHLVEIKAVDDAGNNEIVKVFFYVDLYAPNLTILSPNNSEISETSFRLRWLASDDCGISHFEIKIDDLPWMNVMNKTLITLNLWEGTHIIYVKAIDIANRTTVMRIIVTVKLMHMEYVYIGIAWMVSLIVAVIIARRHRKS